MKVVCSEKINELCGNSICDVFDSIDVIPRSFNGVVLGNFDGIHVGHMALINALIVNCKAKKLHSIVHTFFQHPIKLLKREHTPHILTTLSKKIDLLKLTGIDYLYLEQFDHDFSLLSPESFVKDVLVKKFNIKLAIVGDNYRFGKRCSGTTETLIDMGNKYNFDVIKLDCIKAHGHVISSTLIRRLILEGRVDEVYKFLGRNYSVIGKVLEGRRIGTGIGFPTANIQVDNYVTIPPNGVYVTQTMVNNIKYKSVTNIGLNPTFSDISVPTIETFILDFDKDIYNEVIEVFFLSRIRQEKKFSTLDQLVDQIYKDVKYAREYKLSPCN